MNNYTIVFPVSLLGKSILFAVVIILLFVAGYAYYKKEMVVVFISIPICLFFVVNIFYKSEVRIVDNKICVVKTYLLPISKKCFDINSVKVIVREKHGTVDIASATSFHVVLTDGEREIDIADYPKKKEAELLKDKIDKYIQANIKN